VRLNPEVPPELERIINKALEKDRKLRHQNAADMRTDLVRLKRDTDSGKSATEAPVSESFRRAAEQGAPRQVHILQTPERPQAPPLGWLALFATALIVVSAALVWVLNPRGLRDRITLPSGARQGAAPPKIESIAVLPLANLSGDPQQEYFADGMTEELIATLGKLSALRVISRTSVMRYKKTEKPLPQIARELNVDAVIEGSVLRAGDRVRITAQLIQAANDRHLWAESYERDLRDVLSLQSEVAQAIANEVKIKVTPDEQAQLAGARPVDPDAHEAYLKGRYYFNKRTQEGLTKGIEYFGAAIAKDPGYALAYSGLADCYTLLGGIYSLRPPKEALPRAEAAALKALEIDKAAAEPHTSLAMVRFWYEWDWAGAEREFKRAIEVDPRYSSAHQWYAWLLAATGRLEEAREETRRAQALDPLSLPVDTSAIYIFYLSREYDRAVEECRKALDLDPNFARAHSNCGLAYEAKGMYREAITEFEKAVTISGTRATYAGQLGHALAVSGEKGQALKILEELRERSKQTYVPAHEMAVICVGLGEKDQAFGWLRNAYEERSSWLPMLAVSPLFDGLRSDPRFQALLRRMNLPP